MFVRMKNISNDVLHVEVLEAAKREKLATYELLEFLHEVDRRKLFLLRGYASLFSYVKDYLGYSEHQAFERVSAMRLIFKVDEVKTALQDGKLTLTTVAQLSAHVRKKKLSTAETRDLLPRIENQSKREIEKILEPERPRTIAIEIDTECEALLARFRELDGNPGLSVVDCLKTALRQVIAVREKKNRVLRSIGSTPTDSALPPAKVAPRRLQQSDVSKSRAKNSTEATPSRYISKSAREITVARADSQCEYIDAKTNRRCDGRHGLQFDHVYPHALGGESLAQNLQLLCGAHNRLRAAQLFGVHRP